MQLNLGKICLVLLKMYNEPLCITGKNSDAVLLSLEDYNNLMATIEINSNTALKRKIEEGLNTPLEDCLS